MALSCNGIKKAFGEKSVLEDINFIIEDREKAAIVGVNGAGKSTLFKILVGEEAPDAGTIAMPKETKIGYFSQNIEISSDKTIYDELLTVFDDIIKLENEMRSIEKEMKELHGEALDAAMNRYAALNRRFEENSGYEYKSRIRGVIKGLGFSESEHDKPINELSGGQKTRVALGRLLLCMPDIMLLDEPTNHLDIQAVNWLEDFLKSYNKSVVVISHDRYFINKTASKIIEIENGKSSVYNGNYDFYSEKKKIDREIKMKHYISEQQEINRQKEIIRKLRSFNREKSIKRAESREKLLEKMPLTDRPDNLPENIKFTIVPSFESGNDVLSVKELEKSFDGNKLFENLSFELKRGEKAALIGPNGVGKTTLFRLIMGSLSPDKGSTSIGANVNVGYYDQEHQNIDESKTIFAEISDAFPKLTVTKIRNALAAFVFTGDDVFKQISSLSGGEKGRVSLAKIMLSNANFLLLDEPTNHLDLMSKEILEAAIRNYTGTCLYISHDRYFINNTAQKVIELNKNGADIYLGNYDFYIEHRIEREQVREEKAIESSKLDWKRTKEQQAEERKLKNRIKKTEERIEELEQELKQLDELLEKENVYTNAAAAQEVYENKTAVNNELLQLYELWDSLI